MPIIDWMFLQFILLQGKINVGKANGYSRVEQSKENIIDGEEIKVTMYFDDPVDEKNHYLGEFRSNALPVPALTATNDDFTNGNQNSLEHDSHLYKAGQKVEMKLYGISKTYFNYIDILISQASTDGGPFPTTPVQLKGNCRSITNSNEQVLGFYRLSEVEKVVYTIN